MNKLARLFLAVFLLLFLSPSYVLAADITGTLKKWQPVTLTFTGPNRGEDSDTFLDYRLNVTFTKGGKSYTVPGYFAADGNAANTSASSGNKWRVHFTPDAAGTWNYSVSFRQGNNVAISTATNAGSSAGFFDGETGSFNVGSPPNSAPDFYKWGRLVYTNTHYLKFVDGPYWIKGGTDSPENFLAYNDFDATVGNHTYSGHVSDWNSGDPTWQNNKGKEIIGALNYLSSQQINSIYFLTMNIGGDGKDVWPFSGNINKNGSNDNTRYDISKLDQWNTVFEHAQKKGIHLQFVLTEGEEANKKELDNATLGTERKLYYRELIARFSHHNALTWNMSEEYNIADYKVPPNEIKAWANYIKDIDPYDHPVTVHNNLGGQPATITPIEAFQPFFGNSNFDSLSTQFRPDQYNSSASYVEMIGDLRSQTASSGRPLAVFMDEPDRAKTLDNESHDTTFPMLSGASYLRKSVLWPIYVGGAAGVEWILDGTLNVDEFSSFGSLWKYTKYAREFMESDDLPFWQMEPRHDLLQGESKYTKPKHDIEGSVLAKEGEVYIVHLPKASNTGSLNLNQASGSFTQYWFDPRNGCFAGSKSVTAGQEISLGAPPSNPDNDWVAVFSKNPLNNPQMCSSSDNSDSPFLEQDGLLVMEIESYPLTSFWQQGQDGNTIFYEWGAENDNYYIQNPGSGVMTYSFIIDHAGTYKLRIRNRVRNTDPTRTDESNDIWTKIDDGPWLKTHTWVKPEGNTPYGDWNWKIKTQVESGTEEAVQPEYNFSQGNHTLYISGRSYAFQIDRIHMYQSYVNNPLSLSHPESERLNDLPSDLDGDGDVDALDHNLLIQDFGTSYDIFDYNQLVVNFGK